MEQFVLVSLQAISMSDTFLIVIQYSIMIVEDCRYMFVFDDFSATEQLERVSFCLIPGFGTLLNSLHSSSMDLQD